MGKVCPQAGRPVITKLIPIKMKKIISVIFAITLAFLGMQNNMHIPSGNLNSAGKFLHSFCDDEPIVMRSHVRTSGGLAISSASLTLTPSGTSTPKYSGTTDSNGNYTFDAVTQGDYQYQITASGYYTKTVSLGLHADTDRTDTLIAK